MDVADVKEYIEEHSDIQVVQTNGRVLVLFKPAEKPEFQDISVQVAKI